jgi:hypothetical protein
LPGGSGGKVCTLSPDLVEQRDVVAFVQSLKKDIVEYAPSAHTSPLPCVQSRNHKVNANVPTTTEHGYHAVGLSITIGSRATASAGGT